MSENFIDTRESALHFCANEAIRKQDAGRRDETTSGTWDIFVAHENSPPPRIVRFFVLVVVILVLFYFFLPREITKSTRRSRGRRGKARFKLAPYEREKRFQSKKGRSAPHIPPVVSAGLGATEPLRGSTIRGLSGAQCQGT